MNTQTGIWKFSKELVPKIEEEWRLTLGEGNTNLVKKENIWFKCEYENPTGSVKDRGIAFQLSEALKKGIKKVAISSSGNAAISVSTYAELNDFQVTIFISPQINKGKKEILEKKKVKLVETNRPISDCIKYCNETGTFNLRQSTDKVGHIGYQTIAFELHEIEKEIDAIFFPVSSGTTLKGVFEGYKKREKFPKLYCVQTQSVHPIAENFDQTLTEEKASIVDGIVARFTPLRKEVIEMIKQTGGSGMICADDEVKKASMWLEKEGLITSYEGALALAGLWKVIAKGHTIKNPAVLLTGKKYD